MTSSSDLRLGLARIRWVRNLSYSAMAFGICFFFAISTFLAPYKALLDVPFKISFLFGALGVLSVHVVVRSINCPQCGETFHSNIERKTILGTPQFKPTTRQCLHCGLKINAVGPAQKWSRFVSVSASRSRWACQLHKAAPQSS